MRLLAFITLALVSGCTKSVPDFQVHQEIVVSLPDTTVSDELVMASTVMIDSGHELRFVIQSAIVDTLLITVSDSQGNARRSGIRVPTGRPIEILVADSMATRNVLAVSVRAGIDGISHRLHTRHIL